MIGYTAARIAEITGGTLLCGDGNSLVDNIQYDSREVRSGSLFVPIKGAKTDAHQFITQCFEKGAAAVLTEQDAPQGADKPYIKVQDTKAALQAIAAYYRQSLDVKLIGVTGSVGKTSTKEMIAAALSKGLNVMKTQGNKNSQIGLPMTMFEIEKEHQAAVIEMGMSEFGEMDRLCDIARPEMAVMTNIGKAHIENLKTQQNIMSEKLKITKYFDENGILFLNGDDVLLKTLHNNQPFRTVTFGMSSDSDYYADDITAEGFNTSFMCHWSNGQIRLTIPALGVHSIRNALAAFAAGQALGIDDNVIAEGLLTYKNAPMRQQIHQFRDFVLIDDSYNASPEAAKAALDVLKSVSKGRTAAVLADMLELGDEAVREHYGVGKYLADIGIDSLISVGELSQNTAKGAKDSGCRFVTEVKNNDEAYNALCPLLKDNCTVLIKGSRGMHTDEIVKKIIKEYESVD